MKLLVDDVCQKNIGNLKYLDEIRLEYLGIEIVLFTISCHENKEPVTECTEFINYINLNENVTVGVHAWDHMAPPEQERDNALELMEKSVEILKPYLPKSYLYRPPGFQRSIHTEKYCKQLGFAGIAYQQRIKWFDGPTFETHIINCHLTYNKYVNPINKWKEWTGLRKFKK